MTIKKKKYNYQKKDMAIKTKDTYSNSLFKNDNIYLNKYFF